MLNSAQLPKVTGSLHVRVRKWVSSNQGKKLRSGVIHTFSSCGYFGTGGISRRLDTDVHSTVAAKMSTADSNML